MNMKKMIVFGFVVMLSVNAVGFAVGGSFEEELVEFTGDTGTRDDPIMIEDVHDLQNMSADLTAHYVLANDIDASETSEWNWNDTSELYEGFEPIGTDENRFIGSFDGKGYEITDLHICRSNMWHVGLFGYIGSDGEVRDVGVVDKNINGHRAVGGFVGTNYGTVSNSYSTGSVIGNEWFAGGLVGWNRGTVENSYAIGNVSGSREVGGLIGWNGGTVENSYATGNASGGNNVGGLIGRIYEGWLSNSYATGNVTGDRWVGGLVGSNGLGGIVENSYSTGNVTGDDDVGGLVGSNGLGGTIENSYAVGNVTGDDVGGLVGTNFGTVSSSFWDMKTSGTDVSDGGIGLNTTEMMDINSFADWDIVAVASTDDRDTGYIWNIVDGETYPFLRGILSVDEVEDPEFIPENLVLDVEPLEGEAPLDVNITVSADNVGDADGSIDVVIDGNVEHTLFVPANDSAEDTFTHTFNDTGSYEVLFGDLDMGKHMENITVVESDDVEAPSDDDNDEDPVSLLSMISLASSISAILFILVIVIYTKKKGGKDSEPLDAEDELMDDDTMDGVGE